jgi:hypothetical protein
MGHEWQRRCGDVFFLAADDSMSRRYETNCRWDWAACGFQVMMEPELWAAFLASETLRWRGEMERGYAESM